MCSGPQLLFFCTPSGLRQFEFSDYCCNALGGFAGSMVCFTSQFPHEKFCPVKYEADL